MLYYALFYGTSIQDDVYAQVTGSTLDDAIEQSDIVRSDEESDVILSGEEVPFDCYLDIAELQEWLQDDASLTDEETSPVIEQSLF